MMIPAAAGPPASRGAARDRVTLLGGVFLMAPTAADVFAIFSPLEWVIAGTLPVVLLVAVLARALVLAGTVLLLVRRGPGAPGPVLKAAVVTGALAHLVFTILVTQSANPIGEVLLMMTTAAYLFILGLVVLLRGLLPAR
ncbi:hypothetical protein [Sediminivirga luteola]|uniref:Uncharacterized protein n=1 Tax=Sediminivirga luteola TaxID=1774748 RepID=A0A8J2TX50_9MICO|nr:hypothetical protein [Sediminivirga luteola]MCI2265480.1 hypothetical protein [Sediminivirga luteola]GGA10304.1 hypothetical protein GCM10011333_11280 [Sediminivirga luteola]